MPPSIPACITVSSACCRVLGSVAGSPWSAPWISAATITPLGRSHCVLGLVGQPRRPVLHLRDPRLGVRRALPALVRELLAFAAPVQLLKILFRRFLDPFGLRQLLEVLLVGRPVAAPHQALLHRGVGLKRRGVQRYLPPLQDPFFTRHLKDPLEDLAVKRHVELAPQPRKRRVVWRPLGQLVAQKLPERQRIGASPSDLSLRRNALEVPHEQHPEVDPGGTDGRPIASSNTFSAATRSSQN